MRGTAMRVRGEAVETFWLLIEMTTSAWIDWSQLPTDVSRKITKEAISGEGSYGRNVKFGQQKKGYWPSPGYMNPLRGELFAAHEMRAKHRVHTSEDFHPSAYSRDPDRYLKYAAVTAAAAVSIGLGLERWQARPWEIKSKATELATPDSKKEVDTAVRG